MYVDPQHFHNYSSESTVFMLRNVDSVVDLGQVIGACQQQAGFTEVVSLVSEIMYVLLSIAVSVEMTFDTNFQTTTNMTLPNCDPHNNLK